jgi:hypothetical protein
VRSVKAASDRARYAGCSPRAAIQRWNRARLLRAHSRLFRGPRLRPWHRDSPQDGHCLSRGTFSMALLAMTVNRLSAQAEYDSYPSAGEGWERIGTGHGCMAHVNPNRSSLLRRGTVGRVTKRSHAHRRFGTPTRLLRSGTQWCQISRWCHIARCPRRAQCCATLPRRIRPSRHRAPPSKTGDPIRRRTLSGATWPVGSIARKLCILYHTGFRCRTRRSILCFPMGS